MSNKQETFFRVFLYLISRSRTLFLFNGIQSADSLIKNYVIRICRKSPGNTDSLLLSSESSPERRERIFCGSSICSISFSTVFFLLHLNIFSDFLSVLQWFHIRKSSGQEQLGCFEEQAEVLHRAPCFFFAAWESGISPSHITVPLSGEISPEIIFQEWSFPSRFLLQEQNSLYPEKNSHYRLR